MIRIYTPLLLLFTLLANFCFPAKTFAQPAQTKVTLKVADKNNVPVPFATIKVSREDNTSDPIEKITDSLGMSLLDLASGHKYEVSITAVGYSPFRQGIAVMNTQASFTFKLENAATTLDAVVIRSTKPIMRQEDDKTIVDPENLAASSSSGYEVIEKVPGIFMDQDGNIYLNSTTPASVYINGREQKMSTADIASILKSLPPNSISSIEILRTPSAKYDASGSGGVVNVVLKKGIKIGLNGSVNAGLQQGKYGTQFAGFNLNNSNGDLSSYLNVQATNKNSFEELKTDRLFAPDSLLSQKAVTIYPAKSYYLGYGLNYQLSKKWEISYDGRLSLNPGESHSTNNSLIREISTDKLISNTTTLGDNKNRSFFMSQGVSGKLSIDSLGSEWTTDIAYNFSRNTTSQGFINELTFPVTNSSSGNGDLNTDLNFLSVSSNLLWKLPKKYTIETGVKATITDFKNNTEYFRNAGSGSVKDEARTSAFDYHENILAAYLQASKTLAGFTLKAGTRMENTGMEGTQRIPNDTTFKVNRTDFFPYVFISRPLMSIMSYELKAYAIYRRTISRPGYALLNPSQRYVDPYLFETGNPALKPQFTQNYEVNISVDERPIFAFGINDTKDIFTNVVYQADSSKKVAYRTYDNLGSNKESYFRILGAIPPGGTYFIVGGAQYNHNFYQGLYEGKPLSFKKGSWSLFTYQTLKLSRTSQLSLNGFVRLKGQQQFYELSPFGSLNLSLNQQFFKKKLVVTLSANDLFYTNQNEFTLKQGSISANGYRKSDSRRFGINMRYSFGIRKKDQGNNFLDFQNPDK